MIDWFLEGGLFMWFVLIAGLAAAALAVDAARRLFGDTADAAAVRAEVDGLLFWGVLATVLGLIGTLGGVAVMARSLEQTGGASPAVIWGGLRVALVPTTFGLAVLALSLAAWYGLREALRRRGGE